MSCTGNSSAIPKRQTEIDYMAPVNCSVTENSTVQHILQVSQNVSREVDQQYTIITADLAVAKKAYAIVWQYTDNFNDIIIRLGVFHTICSYLGAVGKLLQGSGFTDIVIEAGVCASGSVEKVLSGKHYNRAMRYISLYLKLLNIFSWRHLQTTLMKHK